MQSPVDARGPGLDRAAALRDDVLRWLYRTSTGKSADGQARTELAEWFAALPDNEETRGRISAIEEMLTATANVPPSHRVEYRERRKARRGRLLKFDGTVLLAEDGSQVTAVDGYDPVKGELVFNVGTRMSLNDLAVKTGLSVQRLISLNAEVFGDEHLDAGTMLKPGDTIDLVRVRLRVQ